MQPESDQSPTHHQEDSVMEDGVLQLRFSGRNESLDEIPAADLAQSLLGIEAFAEQMAKDGLFGDGIPPEVKVRPPRQGSFILETVFEWSAANPEGAAGLYTAAGGAISWAINSGVKILKGDKPEDIEYLDNGNVKVQWSKSGVSEVPVKAWKTLQEMKHPTRKKLAKIMTPLSGEADILEVRNGKPEETSDEILQRAPVDSLTKTDYRLAVEAPIEEVDVKVFTVEGTFESMDFKPGRKWKLKSTAGTRMATMDDMKFQLELERGLRIGKEDIFEVTIEETSTTVGESTVTSWSMVKLVRRRTVQEG